MFKHSSFFYPFEEKDKNKISYFSRFFDVHSFIIQYLFLKGIKNEKEIFHFLYPSMTNLHNPFLLNDMKKAVHRIYQAIFNKELILIYGDYDCDGISSTACLYRALKELGANVYFRIPTREDGYGLSVKAVNNLKEKYPDLTLFITVDNGSNAHDACSLCRQLEIDLIVTDHHDITDNHPNCHAFINPKRKDNTYPFPFLAGVGVTFKLIHALFSIKKRKIDSFIWDYIEFVSLGTIADMVPLLDENRILSSMGIKKWNEHPSPFFRNLFEQHYLSNITSSDISFRIAPLINSIGRISDANPIPILMNNQENYINVEPLMKLNQLRKKLCEVQFSLCDEIVKHQVASNQNFLIAHGNFHVGIIGILASKLAEKYQKPSFVITLNGKGSARNAYSRVHMTNTLTILKKFLMNYGGHEGAAGFSVHPNFITEFINQLQSISISKRLDIDYQRTFHDKIVESKVPTLSMSEFSLYLSKDFPLLEPFGMDNPKPIFHDPNFSFQHLSFFGPSNRYFKLFSNQYECLSFRPFSNLSIYANTNIEILYSPLNDYQFMIEDVYTPLSNTMAQTI